MSSYNAEMRELLVPYTSAFAFGKRKAAPVSGFGPYTQRQADALLTDTTSRQNFTILYNTSTFLATVFGAAGLLSSAMPAWIRGIGLAACLFSGTSSLGLAPKYGWLERGQYPQDRLNELNEPDELNVRQ